MPKGLKAPKFGGRPKVASKPPSAEANKEYGMKPPKKASSLSSSMEPTMGNKEFGFIQSTPKKATAAMMGKAPPQPKLPAGAGPASKNSRKQFKPRGAKVF